MLDRNAVPFFVVVVVAVVAVHVFAFVVIDITHLCIIIIKKAKKNSLSPVCICEYGTTQLQSQPLTVNRHSHSPTYSTAFGPRATQLRHLQTTSTAPSLITHPTCASTSPPSKYNAAQVRDVSRIRVGISSVTYLL